MWYKDKEAVFDDRIEQWLKYWQLKVCVVFQEAMLDDQEAMFDDKEAMFDDQEAMCVPMHFKVTATARFGCDNLSRKCYIKLQMHCP